VGSSTPEELAAIIAEASRRIDEWFGNDGDLDVPNDQVVAAQVRIVLDVALEAGVLTPPVDEYRRVGCLVGDCSREFKLLPFCPADCDLPGHEPLYRREG